MLFALRVILAAAVLALPPALPSDASALRSLQVTESASLPAMRPAWPVPNEPNQLFYLQRSQNKNTVVYTALFDTNGTLRADRPAQVYWRRYNTTGERKALKAIEQRFAYGIDVRPRDVPGEYTVSLKPLPELPMLLRQTGPGKAELLANIGGRMVRAVYAFVTIDETGLIPRVTAISLHGIDPATGRAVSETFSVSGGAIGQ